MFLPVAVYCGRWLDVPCHMCKWWNRYVGLTGCLFIESSYDGTVCWGSQVVP